MIEKVERILNFWQKLEFFKVDRVPYSQNNIILRSNTRNLISDTRTNWEKKEYKLFYEVYIGVIDAGDLLKEFEATFSKKISYKNNLKNIFTYGLILDDKGKAKRNTLRINKLIFSLSKSICDKTLDTLSEERIKEFEESLDIDVDFIIDGVVNIDLLLYYFELIREELSNKINLDENTNIIGYIHPKLIKKDEEEELSILDSFYIDDLEFIKFNLGEDNKIIDLIKGLDQKPIYIDKDIDAMKEVLKIENYPIGKWPNRFKLNLMQQIAINIACSKKEKVFSINGPPGTGKSTLLKEIIALNIIQKALYIAKKEENIFEKRKMFLEDGRALTYYEIDKELDDFQILVASNNNKAVENITKELPRDRIDDEGDSLFKNDIYFQSQAEVLLNSKAWALVSAALGKRSNIEKYLEVLDLILDVKESCNIEEDRNALLNAYDEVLEKVKEIKEDQEFLDNYYKIKDELKTNKDLSLKEKEMRVKVSSHHLKKYDEITGQKFFKDIQNNFTSQSSNPWTDKEYDKKRNNLFYYALKYIKSIVINDNRLRANLKLVKSYYREGFDNKELIFKELLSSIFILTPVISTTLASINRFLGLIDKNVIGNLIIDEGSAVQAAYMMGAYYRSKRVIVTGDTRQIEPIDESLACIRKTLKEYYNIDEYFSLNETSAQRLADRASRYKGMIGGEEVGCPLIIHRRCQEPMFSMSNDICYSKKMFNATKEEEYDGIINYSAWLDIKGSSSDRHYIKEQADVALQLISIASEKYDKEEFFQEGQKKLFVITPFRAIATNIKSQLRAKYNLSAKDRFLLDENNQKDMNAWIDSMVGTVHQFQGREADELIFILGCDEENGLFSARWAGIKSNLINVAITRAKHRILVIGSKNLWQQVNYIKELYKILEERRAIIDIKQYQKDFLKDNSLF